jgi:hypothetical protein
MEMGFPRNQVISALSSCGWNEENAINILLGVDNPPLSQQPPPAAGQPLPQNSAQKSKGGGYFWGKK